MHSGAPLADYASVPEPLGTMGLIGMVDNPKVGASIAIAVAVSKAMK
jgi:uncharacterized protein YjgD (DUF1641 family)